MARFDRVVGLAATDLHEAEERLRSKATRLESSAQQGRAPSHQCLVHQMGAHGNGGGNGRTAARWENPYLAERSHDFVADLMLSVSTLAGRASMLALPSDRSPCVIVAHDLSPIETVGLARDHVLGIVTEVGTRTNHTAILARVLEIPAVVGLARPELFLTQLHGMVRASAHGPLRIIVPMIASIGESRAVRALFDRTVHNVDAAG